MEQQATARSRRAVKTGRVVSNAMDKSVVVAVDRLVKHPLYRKTMRRTSKFMAHDASNECKVGDKVEIQETRPLSKHKRWVVKKILVKAKE